VAELPSDMILFPRRMFYIEAVLYVVVAVGAFGAGYAIGRGSGHDAARDDQGEAARRRVPVEGRASYDAPQGGHNLPDAGAVAIFLPVGTPPAHRPSAEGLVPGNQPPPEEAAAVQVIREMGGAFARADGSGQFMAYVPQPGRYYVLIVSCHATRSGEAPAEEKDLARPAEYLDHASALLRGRQYRWTQEELRLGGPKLDVTFPAEGSP